MAFQTIGMIENFPILGVTPARWSFRAGTDAVREAFTMIPQHAQMLMDQNKGKPVTLKLISNDATIEIRNLYPIYLLPGDDPHHVRVLLADRRIWWKRRRVSAGFNIHRNVGTKRTDPTGTEEIDPTVTNVQYAWWSLKDPEAGAGGRWTAIDVLKEVLTETQKIEKDWNNASMPYLILGDVTASGVPVEQLWLEDNCADAMKRALAYFPGADVYIDKDGQAVVFSRNSGLEFVQVAQSTQSIVGRGDIALADMANFSPSKCRILYSREFEVRHNLSEAGSVGDTVAGLGESRTLTNVVSIPDVTIRLRPRGGGDSYLAAQGTYADFHQYLIALNEELVSSPPPFGDLERIDYDILQQAFIPGMGLWNAFRANGSLNPSANWIIRVGALEDSYRRLFMINPIWTDRSMSIMASSILTVDNALGQRGPARVYADYAVLPSMAGTVKAWTETEKIPFLNNVKGYPLSGIIDDTAKPVRAACVMEQEDQGVFRLIWQVNQRGLEDAVLPSMVEIVRGGVPCDRDAEGKPLLPGPDAHLALTPDVITMDSSSDENTYCKLTGEYKAAVILRHIPASPNNRGQLHEIVISPSDVSGMIPAGLRSSIDNSVGPPLDIRIGPNVETARIPWQDTTEHANLVEASFGIGGVPAPPSSALDDRVINLTTSNPNTGASLRSIALAAAARAWSQFADRFMGTRAIGLRPNFVPEGRVQEVAHEITPRGEGITTMILPEDMHDIDMMAFLPDSARDILLHRPGVERKSG